MNNNIKKLALSICLPALFVSAGYAQKITGKVINSANEPIANVVITSAGCQTARSAEDGTFTIEGVKDGAVISFVREGFYNKQEYMREATSKSINVYMIETDNTRYNQTAILPTGKVENSTSVVGATNINRKDFTLGSMSVEKVLKGNATGLNIVNKSGMTGEGAYMELRGIKSLVAESSPLIVINGVPYMPDMNMSQIVGGYSRSVFQALNGLDIRNITVLKGAEAAVYGSMGSNGVIMIETDQATSTDVNTRISFSAIYGANWNNHRIPMMNASQYKSYLSDMGLTYYGNQESFFKDFTFLADPNANKSYLYKNNTNWQDEIFETSTTMDYLFRVVTTSRNIISLLDIWATRVHSRVLTATVTTHRLMLLCW